MITRRTIGLSSTNVCRAVLNIVDPVIIVLDQDGQ